MTTESDKEKSEVRRKSERKTRNRRGGERGDKRGQKWKNLSGKCSTSPKRETGDNIFDKKKALTLFLFFVCLFLKRNIKYKILNRIQKMSCRECHICAALCGLCSCRENKGI